jgi:hypothetical protein
MLPLCLPASQHPRKAYCNGGACNGDTDAEGAEAESDPDVEKEFDYLTSKKRKYNPYLKYTAVKRWSTRADSILERT